MKNKKFLKAVAAITMSGLTAFGAMGLAACGHTHDYSEWGGQNESQHYKYCPADNEKDETTFGKHTSVCDCGFNKVAKEADDTDRKSTRLNSSHM